MDADPRLNEIVAREKAATKGPWTADHWEIHSPTGWIGETCDVSDYPASTANATFAAQARTDVPWLVAELTEARTKLEIVEKVIDDLRTLLAERDEQIAGLRAERELYVGHEPTVAEEMAYLNDCLNAVHAACDQAEKDATRWEQPLPVPEWVTVIRAAASGGVTDEEPAGVPW